jgi:hypothetical protein
VARFDTPGPLHADLIGSASWRRSFGTAITVFNAVAMGPRRHFAGALGTNILVVLLVCIGVVVFRAYIRHSRRRTAMSPSCRRSSPEQPCESLPGFLRDLDPEIGARPLDRGR